jgi:hypothetical protein
MEIIKWNNIAVYKVKALPTWNNIVIDIAVRSFVKEVNQSQNLNKWTNKKEYMRPLRDRSKLRMV